MIEKDELKDLILRRFSKKKIAIYYGVSTSTVGKYLSRYNIKIGRKKKNVPNGKICILCENELTDRQKRFCSKRCCISFLYKNEYSTSTNSQKHRGFEKKKILIDTLGGKCEKCGYNKNMAALCFHHLTGKDFTISGRHNLKIETLLEEAKKCVLLCNNCHMEEHYPQLVINN